MADLPSRALLEEALIEAAAAHDDYERVVLKGVVDDRWSGFYAAFVLGRVGEFVSASRLTLLLEEVDAGDGWFAIAAEHVLMKLRS